MAILETELQNKIDTLADLAYEKFIENKIEEAFTLYKQAWDLYPEPKYQWYDAFDMARYIFKRYIQIKDYKNAKQWIDTMIAISNYQKDEARTSNNLFYLGTYYYEIGNYKEALESFKKTVSIDGLRYFDYEDPKYLKFYKKPEKYLSGEITPQDEESTHKTESNNIDEEFSELPEHLYEDIMSELDKADESFEAGLYEVALNKYISALEKVPNPKTDWEIATHVYTALADCYFTMQEYEAAQSNYNLALQSPDGTGFGYVWLGLGMAYYELGDKEKAKEALISAYMLEGKEIFEDIEDEYFELIKSVV